MPRLSLLDPTKTGAHAQEPEDKLRCLVIGQEEAIREIVSVYQTHVAGLCPSGRPIGNFLSLGPTGSGKTSDKINISLVSFDEIEKTSDAPWNLLLGILDKSVVVFKPLGSYELNRNVDIELDMVQERIHSAGKSFFITVNESTRTQLLTEGTDLRYGARHLKRAIERLLIRPLANLVASGQIQRGDAVRVSKREGTAGLTFFCEVPAREAWSVAGLAA